MRRFCVLLLAMIIKFAFSQNDASIFYINGLTAFNQNNYKLADSMFHISADLEPNVDVYYNLALSKKKQNDFCAYCNYIHKAKNMGDGEATLEFQKNCQQTDTVSYVKRNKNKYSYYAVFISDLCTENKENYFLYKNDSSNFYNSFILLENSTKSNELAFRDSMFNIDSIPFNLFRFVKCEEPPEFSGGGEALFKFYFNQIVYPQRAKELGIEGVVMISFVINENGNITEAKVLKGIGGGCDEEAIRVCNKMPTWKPAKINGSCVKSMLNIPIMFRLSE